MGGYPDRLRRSLRDVFRVPLHVRRSAWPALALLSLVLASLSASATDILSVLHILFFWAAIATLLAASILIHEYAHAIVAAWNGIGIVSIELTAGGGATHLADRPRPRQALAISLAGPIATLALAGLLLASAYLGRRDGLFLIAGTAAILNIFLAVSNLLPAWPLDGGRAVAAYLATRAGGEEAAIRIMLPVTLVTSLIATIVAWVWGGLIVGVLFAAQFAHVSWTCFRVADAGDPLAAVAGIRLADHAFRDRPSVRQDEDLARALDLLARDQDPLLVRDANGAVVGYITLTSVEGKGSIAEAARRDIVRLDADAKGRDFLVASENVAFLEVDGGTRVVTYGLMRYLARLAETRATFARSGSPPEGSNTGATLAEPAP